MIHRGQLTVRSVDTGPKELLIACNRAEPSTVSPGDVIYPGSEDNEAGEENLPEARYRSESTSNKLSPILPFFVEDEVAQSETVAAAAAAADIHERRIQRNNIAISAREPKRFLFVLCDPDDYRRRQCFFPSKRRV